MELSIPELSLVLLIGVTGSGKSTFARTHFRPTEVISSDFCRGLVADDENDQSATAAAFEVLQFIAGQRLKAGRLTVIDATNVQPEARRELVMLAREHDVLPAAIVLDLPEKLCAERPAPLPGHAPRAARDGDRGSGVAVGDPELRAGLRRHAAGARRRRDDGARDAPAALGGGLVKLQVTTACQGHGRCYSLAPQYLESDDEGFVTIRGGDPIEIPDDQRDLAVELAGTCPESAIVVIDD